MKVSSHIDRVHVDRASLALTQLVKLKLSVPESVFVRDMLSVRDIDIFWSDLEIEAIWYLVWQYREQIEPSVAWANAPPGDGFDSIPLVTTFAYLWRSCFPMMKTLDLRKRAAIIRFLNTRPPLQRT